MKHKSRLSLVQQTQNIRDAHNLAGEVNNAQYAISVLLARIDELEAKNLTVDQKARLVISIVGDRNDVTEAANSIVNLDHKLKSRSTPIRPVKNDNQGRYVVVLVLEDTGD